MRSDQTPWDELIELIQEPIKSREVAIVSAAMEEEIAKLLRANFPPHFPSEGASLSCAASSDEEALASLDRVVGEAEISSESRVVAMWDQYGYGGLSMRLRSVRRLLTHLIAMPPHLYIIAEDGTWCISFRMEGYMGFGFASTGTN